MKIFSSSLTTAQMAVAKLFTVPPLMRNRRDTVGEGDRSHCARNWSALIVLSGGQIADSNGASCCSSADPNNFSAARLARMIFPAAFTRNEGQPAFRNPKMTSFIAKYFAGYKVAAIPQ